MNMKISAPASENKGNRFLDAFKEGRVKTFRELFVIMRDLYPDDYEYVAKIISDIRKYLRREKVENKRFGLSDLPTEGGLQSVVGTLANNLLREKGIEQNKKLPDEILEKSGLVGNWAVEAISLPKAMVNVIRFVDPLTGKEVKSTGDTVATERKTITFAEIFDLE